ncbi:DUF3231 family protein [Paenibacillus xanthanilyticus]|uniref:DUF3231 family protein n=1 Tax=Paenibacillus xanthanilyticus TaxID=1783531 RepID=A0ABV8JWR1_9BACL
MKHHTSLTSAEVGNLWNFYMANTLSHCLLSHFLATVEDKEVRGILKQCDNLAVEISDYVVEVYKPERHPLPFAFNEQDVNKGAPRLYSDNYYIEFMDMMLKVGIIYYAITLPNTSRPDVRKAITKFLFDTAELSNEMTEIMQRKGLYIRPPYMPPSEKEIVLKQSFFNGLFGDKRPLLGVEISQIFANVQFNSLKAVLLTGFAQVAESQKIRDYFIRGKNINIEQGNALLNLLRKEDLPATLPSQYTITASTVPPFSDRLMHFFVTSLSSAKVRNFGDSIAVSPRHDLGALYAKLLVQTGNYAEDGGNLMIENGWMEQPPHTPDRHKLAMKT